MDYRVENKYLVSDTELALIEGRIKHVMRQDSHQNGQAYQVRSVYFDDSSDRCMRENEAGIDVREKYRIRTYGRSDLIRLEIKQKRRGYTRKDSCPLSPAEFEALLENRPFIAADGRTPLNRLYLQMRCSGMRPKALIVYERSAFIYSFGNVRVTFDRNILSSNCCSELFSENIPELHPVLPDGIHILEVKYDELLPEFIAEQLEIGSLKRCSFSKYYLGRQALSGMTVQHGRRFSNVK